MLLVDIFHLDQMELTKEDLILKILTHVPMAIFIVFMIHGIQIKRLILEIVHAKELQVMYGIQL